MTTNRISILCPTRGNPEFVELQLQNMADTIAEPSRFTIFYYVDNNDPTIKEYQFALHKMEAKVGKTLQFEIVSGDPIGTPKAINLIAEMAEADVYMLIADDMIYETEGWDRAVDQVAADYPDGVFNAWFDDNVFGDRLSWYPILGRTWYKTLNYIAPVIFEHYAVDHWMHTLGKAVGRNVFITEHTLGQRQIDDVDTEARYAWEVDGAAKRKMDRDNEQFERFLRYLQLDAELLRKAIAEAEGA
ncbi:MAG: hypothetical protein VW169_05710 [Rhodospirillaceae bacterium]